jgi:4-hydroxy-tetrahydrodipicolinate synthase
MSVTGILPVIPTPFSNGQFDRASFERLLEYMLPHIDGYTLLGSTGEAPSLGTQDRMKIAESALAVTPKDKSVVVGVTHTSSKEAAALVQHAQEHGAAGVLCAAPFYFANSSEGICSYLMELDRVLEVDLIYYDNPVATKTQVSVDWPIEWTQHVDSLRAVKLTDHDLSKVEAWQNAGLKVFGGDDPIAFRYIAAGVDGMMIIAPALFPEPFERVWRHAQRGDLEEAFGMFASEILQLLHVFGIGDEIATTKEIFRQRGLFDTAELLPPLQGVPPERQRLLAIADSFARAQTAKRLALQADGSPA